MCVSAAYRVQQFIRAAGAWFRPEEVDKSLVDCCLPPGAMDLFWAMPRYDRQHAFNVLRALQGQGHTDPDLLAAALLHDAGKTVRQAGRLRLWHRVVVVLMYAFWPSLLVRLGESETRGWRQPFFVQQHHALIGAELARQVGCSPRTVELILHHEDEPGQPNDHLLAALQAADNVN
jgi:putative nucleotidyltransferase with HDIG domain